MARKGQMGAAHFYAEIQSKDGYKNATRMGTKEGGHYGHIRGWDCGGSVQMVHDGRHCGDTALVYATKGSNNGARWQIASIHEHSEGRLRIQLLNPTTKVVLAEFIV